MKLNSVMIVVILFLQSIYSFPTIMAANRDYLGSIRCLEHTSNIKSYQQLLSVIPSEKEQCQNFNCIICKSLQIDEIWWSEWYGVDVDEEEDILMDIGICKCVDSWIEWGEVDSWCQCEKKSIYNGYFDKNYLKFFGLFSEYLDYCLENKNCKCYWPETSFLAKSINDNAYSLFKDLFTSTAFIRLASSFDEQKEFFIDIPPYGFNIHGFTINFVCHSFFYSDYRYICQELEWYSKMHFTAQEQSIIKDKMYDILEKLYPMYLDLYNSCIATHCNKRILWEKRLIEAEISGGRLYPNNFNSKFSFRDEIKNDQGTIDLDFIKLLDIGKKDCIDVIDSQFHLMRGSFYSEALLHNLALESLNEAIRLNPKCIEALKERALVYFELGKMELAINDFKSAKELALMPPFYISKSFGSLYDFLLPTTIKGVYIDNPIDFSSGVIKGTVLGCNEAAIEFVPSTLSSLMGISQGLWAFACSPAEIGSEFLDSLRACIEYIRSNTSKEILEKVVPELKLLCCNWDVLTDYDKGQQIGFIIGKYGIEIFSPVAGMKAFKVFRDLKRANSMLTLECCVLSQAKKEAILASALKHASEREAYLKNVKIHWDRQNKHIPSAHNYQPGKGKITLNSSELEIALKENVGKGERVVGQFGEAGYKERVDFKQPIGEYAIRLEGKTTSFVPTTKGIITYSNDGIHVYPSNPAAIID